MEIQWRGVIVVVGAFLVQLTYGTTYTDGNMVPYIISYIHERVDHSTLMSYTILISVMHPMCQSSLLVPSGYLDARIGTRLTTLISAIIMSAGVLLTYFTIKISFALVILTFGLMFGFGVSMGYGATIACCMKWFPNHRGMVSGIVVAGYGLGAFIFSPLQSLMVNPCDVSATKDGYFVDSGLLDNIPNVLLHLAAIYFIMQIVGVLMIAAPSEIKVETLGSPETNLTPLQAFKSREMHILWVAVFCNGAVVAFITSMYKTYGQTFIRDDHYLALIGSMMSVLNTLGRLVWGFLVDRYSYTPCMRMVTTGITVIMFTMPAMPLAGKAVYTVWCAALFFFTSGTFVLFPAVSATVFGTKHLAANYGIVLGAMVVAGIFAASLTTAFLKTIGYNGMFFILGLVGLLGLLMTFAFEHQLNKRAVTNNNPGPALQDAIPNTENGKCDLSSNREVGFSNDEYF